MEWWRVDREPRISITHCRGTWDKDNGTFLLEIEGKKGWQIVGRGGSDWVERTLERENVFEDESFARSYAIKKVNALIQNLEERTREAYEQRSGLIAGESG